jgi:hypothetical protein
MSRRIIGEFNHREKKLFREKFPFFMIEIHLEEVEADDGDSS